MESKQKTGVVVSDKMNKTRVVEVFRTYRHSLYGKVLRSSKHYYAHDEQNIYKIGDRVSIAETRPLSKLKRWKIVSLLEKTQ